MSICSILLLQDFISCIWASQSFCSRIFCLFVFLNNLKQKLMREHCSPHDKIIPWKRILECGAGAFQLSRSTMDLKDKWRNMCRATSNSNWNSVHLCWWHYYAILGWFLRIGSKPCLIIPVALINVHNSSCTCTCSVMLKILIGRFEMVNQHCIQNYSSLSIPATFCISLVMNLWFILPLYLKKSYQS